MYVELHAHSCFSLLDGASQPEDLVEQAAALNYRALALTDHDAVYGAARFVEAAHAAGIHPILGTELTLENGHHLTILVENEAGWHNLCYLISRARHASPKGLAALPVKELVGCTNGLIALSGCLHGEVPSALSQRQTKQAFKMAAYYKELFGPHNFYIELQNHLTTADNLLIPRLVDLAHYFDLPYVATNNVHYATPEGHRLQDILVCINHSTTLDRCTQRRSNSEYYLKSAGQMIKLFTPYPEAIKNTAVIADRCQYTPTYGLQDLPHYPTPHGMSSTAYLRRLSLEALATRFPTSAGRPTELLNHELSIIEAAGLSNYFLIVWDIVHYARQNNIRCQGRGSAANSLVAYLLHISPVNPVAHDLVFERFLSAERSVVPDIDIDFDAARREEIIQYIYNRYGADHTAMTCTFVTFQRRSALRDVGKVLGVPPEIIAIATVQLEEKAKQTSASQTEVKLNTIDQSSIRLLQQLAQQIHGLPRHLGLHSGGMIITGRPLMGRVPTEPATMQDRVVVQWDKDSLEAANLVKIDILGLRMLSAVTEAAELVNQAALLLDKPDQHPTFDLDQLTFDDPNVYKMIARADTIGVFQVESRAQAQMLPRLQPKRFNDLIVGISLIRPGPIQGNMVHPYLRRRAGTEKVTYDHPKLENALAETMGVILFQEQVLKVAQDLAGFTGGRGEMLRRALGAKQAIAEIGKLRQQFLNGARENGVSRELADKIFGQLQAFGSYSFAKSHAAAFAVLVYQSAWLKRYHPAPFYTALLNNQPMGFWPPAILAGEMRRQGVPVLPVDIRYSGTLCTLEKRLDKTNTLAVRLGLNYVKGLHQTHIQQIINLRGQQPFADLNDLYQRTRLPKRLIEHLILGGAFDFWSQPRRELLWQLGQLRDQKGELPIPETIDLPSLPIQSSAAAMLQERGILGVSTADHILAFYRPRLEADGMYSSQQLLACRHGQHLQVAGQLVVHQSPPTAKGFHFLTLEDEFGMMNVVLRPAIYKKYRTLIHQIPLLQVVGIVERSAHTTNILAKRIAALT